MFDLDPTYYRTGRRRQEPVNDSTVQESSAPFMVPNPPTWPSSDENTGAVAEPQQPETPFMVPNPPVWPDEDSQEPVSQPQIGVSGTKSDRLDEKVKAEARELGVEAPDKLKNFDWSQLGKGGNKISKNDVRYLMTDEGGGYSPKQINKFLSKNPGGAKIGTGVQKFLNKRLNDISGNPPTDITDPGDGTPVLNTDPSPAPESTNSLPEPTYEQVDKDESSSADEFQNFKNQIGSAQLQRDANDPNNRFSPLYGANLMKAHARIARNRAYGDYNS